MSNKLPLDMPSHPQDVYAGAGWISWGDWLGTAPGKPKHVQTAWGVCKLDGCANPSVQGAACRDCRKNNVLGIFLQNNAERRAEMWGSEDTGYWDGEKIVCK